MLPNNASTQPSALSEQGLFAARNSNNQDESWQIVCTTWQSTVLFNRSLKKLIGFGKEHVRSTTSSFDKPKVIWSIPLRQHLPVKQIAAGTSHFLILYENGLLEGYGNGRAGQLGIGYFINDKNLTVSIVLPDNAVPDSIYCGEYYSLVLSTTGKLYSFGSNDDGQLGIGSNALSVAFPTAVDMPRDAVIKRVFTEHNRTIVVCENGAIYGFGYNCQEEFGKSSSRSRFGICISPVRLHHFEALHATAFAMSRDAVIVLTKHGTCYFFGINATHLLPVNYNTGLIELPPAVKARTISLGKRHLMLISEDGELWGIGSFRGAGNYGDHQMLHEKIELPGGRKVQSVTAAYHSTIILAKDSRCYVMGNNNEFQLGLDNPAPCAQPTAVSLRSICFHLHSDIVHSTMVTTLTTPLESLYPTLAQSSGYQPIPDLLDVIANDSCQVIEIIRPPNHGKSVALSRLNQLLHEQDQAVILLDFSELSFNDYYDFHKSYQEMVRRLFVKYRRTLFEGILKDKQSKQQEYQYYALNDARAYSHKNPLHILIEYLSQQYGKQAYLLIDNADYHLRYSPNVETRKILEHDMQKLFASFPHTHKAVMMAVHPTTLGTGNAATKRTYSLQDDNAVLSQHLCREYQVSPARSNLIIDELRMNPDVCELISDILAGNTLKKVIAPDHSLFDLIREGLLQARCVAAGSPTLLISAPDNANRTRLVELHRKWQLQNLNRITVVLDIDEVLATHDSCDAATAQYFLKKGAVIYAYNYTHYIVPGALELMRFLFSCKHVQIVFFSAGYEARNIKFVHDFLVKALGDARYQEVAASNILILSENHTKNFKVSYQYNGQTYYRSESKKDIRDALAPEDDLAKAILVDNNANNVVTQQQSNFLCAETVFSADFQALGTLTTRCENADDALFRKVNAIFHVASVLEDCILHRDDEPFARKLQAAPTNESYASGLRVLQQFNPALTLNTPSSYRECAALPRSASQEFNLHHALEHEYGKGTSRTAGMN